MLPYIGQGSAQALEDAAVLCLALNQVSTVHSLPIMLRAYELCRRPRAEKVAAGAGITRSVLHLIDGPAQQERDAKFRTVSKGGPNPDLL